MKTRTSTISAAVAIVLAIVAGPARGAATVNFSSTAAAVNVQSDGSPMDGSFTFQIGTFSGNFTPHAGNTSGWLAHWVPLSDAAGDPIAAATVAYTETFLPSPPFQAGAANFGFSGSAQFDHNEAPFTTAGTVYIWGYDNRQTPGGAEWFLVTDSNWQWPSGTTNPPAATFSIGSADNVILGSVNTGGHHMQSAAVNVSSPATPSYDAWLAAHFDPDALANTELADSLWGVLADPDGDGIANVIEFFTASDPNDGTSLRPTSATSDDGALVFTFFQARDTAGTVGEVEWSSDLIHWQTAGVTTRVVEDLGDVLKIEASVDAGGGEAFARLNVRRSFE